MFPPLAGVATDVRSMRSLLAGAGFEVTVARGAENLTSTGVKASLLRLVDETGPGDLAIIYLTGHGYRYPDTSGDEVDGWDEAFVCADGPIPDDWFRAKLWPHTKPGARIVAVVDACHSASAVLGLRPGDIPEPTLATNPAPVPGSYRLVLAACRDYETTVALGPSDGGGGVVTTVMREVLASNSLVSYRDLWREVAERVRDRYHNRRIGQPRIDSLGPDDGLLDSIAFHAI